jgi:hypothetical protein
MNRKQRGARLPFIKREATPVPLGRWTGAMEDKRTVYDDPSEVSAVDGAVEMDGPDAVDVALTPEAAEETSVRLSDEAVRARGQRRLARNLHRPK